VAEALTDSKDMIRMCGMLFKQYGNSFSSYPCARIQIKPTEAKGNYYDVVIARQIIPSFGDSAEKALVSALVHVDRLTAAVAAVRSEQYHWNDSPDAKAAEERVWESKKA
jgi:hypothetical protein